MRTPRSGRPLIAFLMFPALAGCTGSKSDGPPATVFGGDRPMTVEVPASYDPATPLPLLLILHGYGVDGAIQAAYLQVHPLVEAEKILLAVPDGTMNGNGDRFWNATDACCGFGSDVDDVGYLLGLVQDISEAYAVDPRRVYVWGHSNGGFMAHRLACEASQTFAAVVSLAGATYSNAASCTPAQDVSVLQIHGDADDTILYAGGATAPGAPAYPSALESVTRWQDRDSCDPGLVTDPPIDFDTTLAGDETRVEHFAACDSGTGVELWTIQGGSHIPDLPAGAGTRVWQWLAAHPSLP